MIGGQASAMGRKATVSIRATPAMIEAGVVALLPFLEGTEGFVDVYATSEAVIEAALMRSPYAFSRIVRGDGKG
jgi:hypothetical protein